MIEPRYIYHIVLKADWEQQIALLEYTAASLKIERFIHASRLEQIAATLSRFFASEMENVVILKIDTTLLLPKLVYEPADDELFPHIFGGINKNAIIEILGEEFIRTLLLNK
jgi:uncharacterized protein (DUF952 family)